MSKKPEEKVIQAMERSADIYGIRRSYARLYGILYFSPDEMTLDELAEESGYARSTISSAMKKLEEFHMAQRNKKEGEGKTLFYTAEDDMEKMFMEFLDNQVAREIDIMTDALEEAEEELDEEDDSEKLEKVKNLEKTYRRSERIINLLKRMPSGNYMERLTRLIKRDSE